MPDKIFRNGLQTAIFTFKMIVNFDKNTRSDSLISVALY